MYVCMHLYVWLRACTVPLAYTHVHHHICIALDAYEQIYTHTCTCAHTHTTVYATSRYNDGAPRIADDSGVTRKEATGEVNVSGHVERMLGETGNSCQSRLPTGARHCNRVPACVLPAHRCAGGAFGGTKDGAGKNDLHTKSTSESCRDCDQDLWATANSRAVQTGKNYAGKCTGMPSMPRRMCETEYVGE